MLQQLRTVLMNLFEDPKNIARRAMVNEQNWKLLVDLDNMYVAWKVDDNTDYEAFGRTIAERFVQYEKEIGVRNV